MMALGWPWSVVVPMCLEMPATLFLRQWSVVLFRLFRKWRNWHCEWSPVHDYCMTKPEKSALGFSESGRLRIQFFHAFKEPKPLPRDQRKIPLQWQLFQILLTCVRGFVKYFLRVPQLLCTLPAAQASQGNSLKIVYKTSYPSNSPS